MKAQETAGVRWRIRYRHRKDADMPFHEWLWTGAPVKADSLGRLNGRMHEPHWVSVRCLYADCPAEALIRIADMVALLPVLVKRRVTQPLSPTVDSVPLTSPHSNGAPLNQQAPDQPELTAELLTIDPHQD
jgi:hypothetical protein